MLHLFSDNKEDVISLFQMLASQIPAITDEISKHIEAQNWQATFQAVHRLKSSVQLLKIGSLIDRINELEEWTRDEIQKDRITRTFDSFKKDCELTTSLLKEEIIRLKNSKS
jgi:HPt (histidine-containing phosphotransfer) domain-containing protein